jgi:hypothetical protein
MAWLSPFSLASSWLAPLVRSMATALATTTSRIASAGALASASHTRSVPASTLGC